MPRLDEGLDASLWRTYPLAAPCILRSSRLDGTQPSGNPDGPGKTWEVIVAEHSEQTLASRNSSLMRNLEFQGLTFTLLRRFVYQDLLKQLGEKPILRSSRPAVPAYMVPDHINLDSGIVDVESLRSLDISSRYPEFGRGYTALQWEALPFYYEHCLLVAAQSARTVSALSHVVQRDFQYKAPNSPQGMLTGTGAVAAAGATHRLTFKMACLKDALPANAELAWPQESVSGEFSFADMLDPEVVYQLVETYMGNQEIHAEFYLYMKDVPGAGSQYVCEVSKLSKTLAFNSFSFQKDSFSGVPKFTWSGFVDFGLIAPIQLERYQTIVSSNPYEAVAPTTPAVEIEDLTDKVVLTLFHPITANTLAALNTFIARVPDQALKDAFGRLGARAAQSLNRSEADDPLVEIAAITVTPEIQALQATLPAGLNKVLVIGTKILTPLFIWSAAQTRDLILLFEAIFGVDNPADGHQISRLYEEIVGNCLKQSKFSTLQMRCRRGSAKPSDVKAIEIQSAKEAGG
ncbi:MAG: hypothetical protein IPP97_26660 [Candidatus Obscuribacter sp.]|nr:hypothetical protein [Candidatus Obscuribacter sp.]